MGGVLGRDGKGCIVRTMERIARVFPRRTAATPIDALAYVDCQPPMLALPEIDEIYVSVTFSWDVAAAERLEEAWRVVGVPVKVGGRAYGDKGGVFMPGMYLKTGYVITSRGCNGHCWFCDAWRLEGPIRELPIVDGWNVLDNNLLACSNTHIEAVFQMLSRQPERALFTGGLEARLLTQWDARRLREIKAKRMYFAYDTPDDYEPLVEAGKVMRREGHTFEAHSMCCYVLIGYKGDTFEQAERRLTDTVQAGFVPYAMLYRGEDGTRNPAWARFQREWLRPEILGAKMARIRKIEDVSR